MRSFGNTLQRIMPDDAPTRHSEFLRYYAESEGSLRTFIRTMLQSREDISEVLQETTLFLWDRFSEFDQSKDFKNWAFGVARMKALALLRDRRRDRHIFDDDLVERLADEAIGMESRSSKKSPKAVPSGSVPRESMGCSAGTSSRGGL